MSSIIVITMLASASASFGNYKKSVYIGTPCECNASAVNYARIYDPSASPRDGTYAGECKAESVDPLDVWNGLGVEFYGFTDDHDQWDTTFKYQIDCALPCSISEVHLEGTAWSDKTRLEIEATQMRAEDGRTNLKGHCLLGASDDLHRTMPKPIDIAGISLDEQTCAAAYRRQFPTDYVQQFTITEYQNYIKVFPRVTQEWRCRNSLSIVASASAQPTFGCRVGSGDVDCEPGVSSTLSRTDESTTTDCHADDDCSGSQICDAFECVESSGDSSDQSTHCHSHDDCPGMQICNTLSFECEDSESSEGSGSRACEARLHECEAMQDWQHDLILRMAGGEEPEESEDNEEEEVAPLSAPAGSGFGAKEALIGCLVLTNVVLLACACLGKSSMAKNKPVYGGVPGTETEQEDLCA